MSKNLEQKFLADSHAKIDQVREQFNLAQRNIFPAYMAQFQEYRKNVLALLEDPNNISVADDPEVVAAVEASNQKVINGLSLKSGKENQQRKRGEILKAGNDNYQKLEKKVA